MKTALRALIRKGERGKSDVTTGDDSIHTYTVSSLDVLWKLLLTPTEYIVRLFDDATTAQRLDPGQAFQEMDRFQRFYEQAIEAGVNAGWGISFEAAPRVLVIPENGDIKLALVWKADAEKLHVASQASLKLEEPKAARKA